jgi:hypothetical protein
MAREKPEFELKRLRTELYKTLQEEVFGGLTLTEREEYNRKSGRIHELETEIQASAVAEKSSASAKTEQQLQWNKEPETDTPQGQAHLPYRSREKDVTGGSTDSRRQRGSANKAPEEKGDE